MSKQLLAAFFIVFLLALAAINLSSCTSSAAGDMGGAQTEQALPVITVTQMPATLYNEYSASLEGSKDIEIRPQVEGHIEQIYIDEGARVRKGQVLFRINDRPYREALNNARAALAAAEANLSAAQINVSRLKPLVESKVVASVQLESAEASWKAARATVAQMRAQVEAAEINLGYTVVKSPVDGFAGRIPYRTGSLVGMNTPEPLTVISEISTVYAYFSLGETEFLKFKDQYPGATVAEKLQRLEAVDLVLADNSVYPLKGKVEMIAGQFDQSTGSITLRAAFPNAQGLLRSGNTGRIRLPLPVSSALVVPQDATYELQDKVFAFVVGDSNKVSSTPLSLAGSTGNYYLVKGGLKEGDRIVFSGLDRLKEGAVIRPEPLTMDSLLRVHPL